MLHFLTTPLCRFVSGVLVVPSVILILATTVYAQGSTEISGGQGNTTSPTEQIILPEMAPIQLVRTDSPRETFGSYLRLIREMEDIFLAYRKDQSRTNADRMYQLVPMFHQLLDLSAVPEAFRRKAGNDVSADLVDIIGRLDLPPLESIPDAGVYDGQETPARWRIPGTPITIVRIEDGPRQGEFLFGARTVSLAPAFYKQIQHLPLRSSLGIESWNHTIPLVHGPLIPAGLVSALPDILKQTWLETPIWKILTVVILSALATLVLVLLQRAINARALGNKVTLELRRLLTPAAIILAVLTLSSFFAVEVNVVGTFAQTVDFTMTLVIFLAAVWIFWLVLLALSEWIILSPKIPDDSLDANLLRLSARVIGFVGGVLILAYGAQDLGLPVLSLMAGLGVGGLAVALAIRPTLENLIAGAVLFMDRPVRVGDFCSFGAYMGTVESIGVRSTKIRALDRTVISLPNATFADMEIINWAKCDRMEILTKIGLRYETDPDQLRYVLAKLREMFYAHPKIDNETVRVRFVGYGTSSLDVEIRVYALTRDWNDFYAIREDVFLRLNEVVRESGADFAFPSQTLYMGRDAGLDEGRSHAAKQEVESWRRSGQLPFPRPAEHRIEEIAGTLDYPPHGSPDADSLKVRVSGPAEPLSVEPQYEDTDNAEQQSEPERR